MRFKFGFIIPAAIWVVCIMLCIASPVMAKTESKLDILAKSRIAISRDGKVALVVQKNINYFVAGEVGGELRLPLVFANLSGEPGITIQKVGLKVEGLDGQFAKTVVIGFPALEQANTPKTSLLDITSNRLTLAEMKTITSMSVESFKLPGTIEKGKPQTLLISAMIQKADGSQSTVEAKSTITFRSLPVRTGWYGGDGHMHSTLSDGLDSPDARAAYLKNAGMGWAVLTDHEKLLRGHSADYFKAVAEYAGQAVFPLGAGMEIAAAGERGHALAYGLEEQISSSSFPADYQYECQTLIDQINRLVPGTSFTVLAHPFSSAVWQDIKFNNGFQAMEIANGGVINEQAFAEWMRRLRNGEKVTALGGSDCHLGYPDGMTYLYIPDYSSASITPVLNAIKKGRASVSEKGNLAVFAVNGQAVGSTVKAAAGAPLAFTLVQQASSGVSCSSLELLDENGQVVCQAANPTEITTFIKPAASRFYLIRADFSDGSKSISNPVYIELE